MTENQLKAVYLYKFILFIRWPHKSYLEEDDFNLCVIGESPFNEELNKAVEGEKILNRPVNVLQINRVEHALECKILYISKSEHYRYKSILDFLKRDPVLTVSSLNDFVKSGGMIQFYHRNNRVHFIISPQIAREKQLNVSSNLLSVAAIYKPKETADD